MTTLSLAMIVKNEGKVIERCLNSVKHMVDEMIVVDTGSTDSTKLIAERLGAKVFDFKWIDDFAAARNFSIACTTGNWILVLDADEYFEEDYTVQLRQFINQPLDRIGKVTIISSYLDNGQLRTAKSAASRLFPRSVSYTGIIHEQLASSFERTDTPLIFLHDGYYETDKSERNLSLLLKELASKPEDSYLLFKIGKEYHRKKDAVQAEAFYTKALSNLQNHSTYSEEPIVDYLYLLLETKQLDKALAALEVHFVRLQHVSDYYFVCGLIYLELALQQPDEALQFVEMIENSFQYCLHLGQQSATEYVIGTASYLAAYNLGLLYEMFGQTEKATAMYRLSSSSGYEPARDRLNFI
ncbi:tetratricopeptide repeat-containing glycosyltransferase family 2 protein [Paenibacillus harenae]|uniref:tetratricopeptide repeat-containing glycosyltransferase family 2 protein n=1 Tax=Paenibacillus harenae TaxID=306543 RepID=UPI0004195244|nr:glycosyltransferase family 2 protein [Paenibacillus harenae]